MRYLQPHYLLVWGGTVAGTIVGFRLDTHPAVIGIFLGIGGGLSLGAFLAAIFTNTPLVGGPAPRRRPPPGIFEERPPRDPNDPRPANREN